MVGGRKWYAKVTGNRLILESVSHLCHLLLDNLYSFSYSLRWQTLWRSRWMQLVESLLYHALSVMVLEAISIFEQVTEFLLPFVSQAEKPSHEQRRMRRAKREWGVYVCWVRVLWTGGQEGQTTVWVVVYRILFIFSGFLSDRIFCPGQRTRNNDHNINVEMEKDWWTGPKWASGDGHHSHEEGELTGLHAYHSLPSRPSHSYLRPSHRLLRPCQLVSFGHIPSFGLSTLSHPASCVNCQ